MVFRFFFPCVDSVCVCIFFFGYHGQRILQRMVWRFFFWISVIFGIPIGKGFEEGGGGG
jgi:hypothetical protein